MKEEHKQDHLDELTDNRLMGLKYFDHIYTRVDIVLMGSERSLNQRTARSFCVNS